MSLSPAMQKLIERSNLAVQRQKQAHEDEAFNHDTVRDGLARLGFEKATKQELKEIILQSLVAERDVALHA